MTKSEEKLKEHAIDFGEFIRMGYFSLRGSFYLRDNKFSDIESNDGIYTVEEVYDIFNEQKTCILP